MFFPIGDDQIRGGSYPVFSYAFIAINCVIFLFQVTLPIDQLQEFVYRYSAIPTEILAGQDYHTLFTSMFIHGGWMHLISNMLFLWVFADNIEAVVGNERFLLFYLLSGVVASLAHVFFNPMSEIP
nr:rhomboid family intramembrane serine protease [Saprospiraceae bacterium]